MGKDYTPGYEVIVTGLGVISSFGRTFTEYMEGLESADKTVIPQGISTNDERIYGIGVDYPEDCLTPEERLLYLCKESILMALADWRGEISQYDRVALLIGSGMGFADQLSELDYHTLDSRYLSSVGQRLADILQLNCEIFYIGSACSAGSQAISYGMDLLRFGRKDLVIAGGAEILSKITYSGFRRLNAIDYNGCKPFDKRRKGIVPGEGAAFFIMERGDRLPEHGNVYCQLAGSGVTVDAHHVVQIRPDGREIIAAIDQALASATCGKDEVDVIVAHGTGTIQNDRIESAIISKYFADTLERIKVTAPKGAIGHTGGASGAFGLLTAIGIIQRGVVPPVCNLEQIDPECQIPIVHSLAEQVKARTVMVNCFAFGGMNVILLCNRWKGISSCRK
ncbi:beta-ketoacyl synthase N-terminal-like domain-containing protein [Paenibacillus sp. M1]|uniref:Beta-ketoacyl synthase N-terminal-like domain-containing protein n=1 Tax=Paenibacillus haidiansis TaxID=1574488 RepID=A0ABU7VQB1_9BACL